MVIPEKVRLAMASYKNEILPRAEIIKIVKGSYPEINISSIIPSDYCENITNKDSNAGTFHIFRYMSYNKYKVL